MKKLVKGMGGIAVAVGAGAIGYVALSKIAANVSFLQLNWWASPLAAVLLGLIAHRYSPAAGYALAGMGGAFLLLGYMSQTSTAKGISTYGAANVASFGAGNVAGALGEGEAAMAGRGPYGRQYQFNESAFASS